MRDYTRPVEETVFDVAYAIIPDERLFPVTESDVVVVRTSARNYLIEQDDDV